VPEVAEGGEHRLAVTRGPADPAPLADHGPRAEQGRRQEDAVEAVLVVRRIPLLEVDVQAGVESSDGHLGVQVDRRGDHHGVDVVAFDQLAPIFQ